MNTKEIVERLRQDARAFRESARQIRPHPANPFKIDAADVSRFVDVSCAYVAQEIDEAADLIEAQEAEIVRLRGALEWYGQQMCEGHCEGGPVFDEELFDCAGCRARSAIQPKDTDNGR